LRTTDVRPLRVQGIGARLLALGLAAVVLTACDVDVPAAAPLELETGEDHTLEGVVVENSIDPCRFPDEHDEPCDMGGPDHLRVDVDGAGVSVTYAYGEHEPCDNLPVMDEGADARVGMRIEVHGLAVASSALDVCQSDEYYIATID
jgi:hypothetical protein